MPEQPQWSERTLDMPPQDPWAEPPTTPVPPSAPPPHGGRPAHPPTAPFATPGGPAAARPAPPEPNPFSRGRAAVNPRPRDPQHTAGHEPTGTGWPGAEPPVAQRPISWRLRDLRRGGEWSSAALLFAFVCWGIWAISSDGSLTTPVIVFILSVIVAAGLFALSRVLGHVILERQLGRVRRTARGSHMVAALFLAGVGIAHLRQTEWVMDAYRWVLGVF